MKCQGDTIALELEAAGMDLDQITGDQLLALGFKPTRAWVHPGNSQFVVVELQTPQGPVLQDIAFG